MICSSSTWFPQFSFTIYVPIEVTSLRPPMVFFSFAKAISSKRGLRAQSVDSIRSWRRFWYSSVFVTLRKCASLVWIPTETLLTASQEWTEKLSSSDSSSSIVGRYCFYSSLFSSASGLSHYTLISWVLNKSSGVMKWRSGSDSVSRVDPASGSSENFMLSGSFLLGYVGGIIIGLTYFGYVSIGSSSWSGSLKRGTISGSSSFSENMSSVELLIIRSG